MRITFVIPESSRSYSFIQPPWGSLKTAAVMEKVYGCQFTIVDNRVERLPLRALVERIEASNPDVLMCTTNTYDQSQVYILGPRLHRIMDTVKKLSELPYPYIVCGPHIGANTELFSRDVDFDFGLKGQFDMTLPASFDEICKHIEQKNKSETSSRLKITFEQPKEQDVSLERIIPDYSKIPMERYFGDHIRNNVARRKANWGLVLGSRGCPYSCEFCHLFLGRGLNARPIDSILEEIEVLYRHHNVRGFWFMDYTFTANKKWTKELCEGIRDLGFKDLTFSCQTRADRIDEETAQYLSAAGCSDVWLGIESFGNSTLEAANKNIPISDTYRAIQLVRKYNMQPVSYIMLGLPGETAETLKQTLSMFADLELSYLDGIELSTPRPGTPLFDKYKDEFPRLKTSWDYLDTVAGLLGNEVTPGMFLEAFKWLAKRTAIYDKSSIPDFNITAADLEIKRRILDLGRIAS
ncbi:MAG: B12-binding domain-containing radical SAM protein [Alphaproteobacteria bacterium]|nr:B12-binding domain-containing radical SAM protein [Alphaproteobacteria bacterium]